MTPPHRPPGYTPMPTVCTPPPGWVPYTVRQNDTLDSLARYYDISVNLLVQANCLTSQFIYPGQWLYVPPGPPPPTVPPCGPPPGWVQYTVRPGDTLYSLSVQTSTPVPELMHANCLHDEQIYAGQLLWLRILPPQPPTATHTYTPPAPPVVTHTPTPSATPLVPTPTSLPSPTATQMPTSSPTLPLPTATPTPTSTDTPVPPLPPPTNTPVPFPTPPGG